MELSSSFFSEICSDYFFFFLREPFASLDITKCLPSTLRKRFILENKESTHFTLRATEGKKWQLVYVKRPSSSSFCDRNKVSTMQIESHFYVPVKMWYFFPHPGTHSSIDRPALSKVCVRKQKLRLSPSQFADSNTFPVWWVEKEIGGNSKATLRGRTTDVEWGLKGLMYELFSGRFWGSLPLCFPV